MKISYITQVIYKGTQEAKNKKLLFCFSGKPVEYTFAVLECRKCGLKMSINDKYYQRYPKKLLKYQEKHGDYRIYDDYNCYLDSVKSRKYVKILKK